MRGEQLNSNGPLSLVDSTSNKKAALKGEDEHLMVNAMSDSIQDRNHLLLCSTLDEVKD